MSDRAARAALETLERLCLCLETAPEAQKPSLVRIACQCVAHPALAPFAADPLRRLDGSYPAVDAWKTALEARRDALLDDRFDLGLIWGALLVGGRAMPCRVAVALDGPAPAGAVAVQPVSDAVAGAARSAWRAVQALLGDEAPAGFWYAIELLEETPRSVEDIQGDSLGLPLALALLSAARRWPLPPRVGATGAIGRRFVVSIDAVGGVEAKMRALARRRVVCLTPEDVPDLRSLAAVLLEGGVALMPDRTPHKLPAETSPLYGRARESVALARQLREPNQRLVTLTGAGGVGKTRLALRVARCVADAFVDGVYFLSLEGGAKDAERMLREALGLEPSADLLAALATRSILLVLDHGEAVEPGVVALVARLLQSTPGVRCLATARSPLGLADETRVDLRPLPMEAAVGLFRHRAAAADPDFAVRGNEATLQAICRCLDGLPLAIEIVAAWVRYLTLGELERCLSQNDAPFVSRVRDAPARQRTVRAALESSYALLEETEARCLAWLSVFGGSFTSEDAITVLAGTETLESLARLEERSLLQRQRSRGDVWFSLLGLVRAFAREKLIHSGEEPQARAAHAAYCVALATALGRSHGAAAFDRLEVAVEDLRQALNALRAARSAALPGFVADLAPFLRQRGYLQEQVEWPRIGLDQIAESPDAPDPPVLARLHLALALALQDRQEIGRAESHVEAAYAAARFARQPDLLGDTLAARGALRARRGRFEAALADHDRALEAYRRAGDPRGEAASLNNRALARMGLQQLDLAANDLAAAVALARAARALPELANGLNNLGCLHRQRGERDRARRCFSELLAVSRDVKDAVAVAVACRNLAEAALGDGDRGALALLARAERIFILLGHPLRHEATARLDDLAAGPGGGRISAARRAVSEGALDRLLAEAE